MPAAPANVRLALKAAGFSPLPLKGKAPIPAGWQDLVDVADDEIRSWKGANTGMLTAHVPTLDIDITHREAAEYVQALVECNFEKSGQILVRYGNRPKRAIPFRTAQPFKKMARRFQAPDGTRHKLEWLGDGQQLVVAGKHPDTRNAYEWDDELAPWNIEREDLPEISEEAAREILDAATEGLAEQFGFEVVEGGDSRNGNGGMDANTAFETLHPGHVHDSQLSATASLLRQGHAVDVVVQQVLAATDQAAEPNWNMEREEQKIRRLCFDFIAKHSELSSCLPDTMRAPFEAMVAQGVEPGFRYRRGVGWVLLGSYTESRKAPGGASDTRPGKPCRSQLIAFEDVSVDADAEFFIEGILPREGIGVLYGPPKAHKSFAAFDMVMHVAIGQPYRGRAVQQAPVVYCAFEGQRGFSKRIEAYKRRHARMIKGRVPFYLQPVRLNIAKEAPDLIRAIQGTGITPGIVVLDTLNRSLVGSESKDVDMAGYLAAADEIRQAFSCLVLIVHHSGLEGGRPRGHTSLTGAADAQLAVSRQDDVSRLEVEFLKDGQEGTTLFSKLEVVDIGFGKTSCVIVEAEEPKQEKTPTKKEQVEEAMHAVLVGSGPLGLAEWHRRVKERLPTADKDALYKARKQLVADGQVIEERATGVFHVS